MGRHYALGMIFSHLGSVAASGSVAGLNGNYFSSRWSFLDSHIIKDNRNF